MTSCQDLLEMSNNDLDFFNKIVMGDESWCFAYDPESKWQSATCIGPNLSKMKKLCFQKSCVKMMMVAFLDSRGFIHKELVSSDKTINAKYYKGVTNRLRKQIARVHPHFHALNDWFLLHDNSWLIRRCQFASFCKKKKS